MLNRVFRLVVLSMCYWFLVRLFSDNLLMWLWCSVFIWLLMVVNM